MNEFLFIKKEHEKGSRRKKDLDKIRHICSCGHTVYVPSRYDFCYCNHCWKRVYRDKQAKFKHKLLSELGCDSNEQISKQKSIYR